MSGPEHPGTLCSSRGRRAQNPLASEVVREDLRHQFAQDCLAADRRQMTHQRGGTGLLSLGIVMTQASLLRRTNTLIRRQAW